MNERPTVLLLGATGRTGLCALQQLGIHDVPVRALVRTAGKIPEALRAREGVEVVEASVLALSDAELERHVREADVIISCLGHVLSLAGVYGAPRDLVTQTVARVTRAARSVASGTPKRLILMSSVSVNQPEHRDTRRGLLERMVLALICLLLPPAKDNQSAADFLLREVGPGDRALEWVVVRPDALIEGEVGRYAVHEALVDSLFAPGKTTMRNIGHFMAALVTDTTLWSRWRGKLPVIVDESAPR